MNEYNNENITVSKNELRRFFVNYHGFNEFFDLTAEHAVDAIFDRLRSVQFDPLNVTGRNAELVMFARNSRVSRADLFDALYKTRRLVDGWDKVMCIYRTAEFEKFGYVRDDCTTRYEQIMRWRGQEDCHAYTDDVYSYIVEHGATFASDIPSPKTNRGGWGNARVAGVCCEYLWNAGKICVAEKKGVIKSFDLTERLIGKTADNNAFTDKEEFLRWYTKRRISAVGAARLQNGGAWLGAYLEETAVRTKTVNELVELGELIPVTVADVKGKNNVYYINSCDMKFFAQIELDRAVFVAPLDNLLWDRKTVNNIFDFDYSWEVYVPPAKRKYGYYVLPVLIGDRFIGRIEPIVDKKSSQLIMKNFWFERDHVATVDETDMIENEFNRLAAYLNVSPEPTAKAKLLAAAKTA